MLYDKVLNNQLLYSTLFYFHGGSEKPFNKKKTKKQPNLQTELNVVLQ